MRPPNFPAPPGHPDRLLAASRRLTGWFSVLDRQADTLNTVSIGLPAHGQPGPTTDVAAVTLHDQARRLSTCAYYLKDVARTLDTFGASLRRAQQIARRAQLEAQRMHVEAIAVITTGVDGRPARTVYDELTVRPYAQLMREYDAAMAEYDKAAKGAAFDIHWRSL